MSYKPKNVTTVPKPNSVTDAPTWADSLPTVQVLATAIDAVENNKIEGKNSFRSYSPSATPNHTVIDGTGGARKLPDGLYKARFAGYLDIEMKSGDAKYSIPTFVLGDGSLFSVACRAQDLEMEQAVILDLMYDEKNNRMMCKGLVAA